MSGNRDPSNKFEKLRKQADELIKKQPYFGAEAPSDILDLINELRIHQAELEIQNEELKRAQNELSELHHEYETLYEFAPCGYVTLNAKGMITHANLTAVRLLGAERQLIRRLGISPFLASDYGNSFLSARIKAGETGEKQSIELPLAGDKGSRLWVRADIEADRDKNGAVIQWRIVLVDITLRRKAEEERKIIQNELNQAQKLEAIGILAGGLAHDYNNILSVIIGNLELAKDTTTPQQDISVFLAEAEKAAFQAKALTSRLLSFSRGGAPVKALGSIKTLVEDTGKFAISDPNIKVESFVQNDLWAVEYDEAQMRIALKNLLLNAAEAMPHGGIIKISAKNHIDRNGFSERSLPLVEGRYITIVIRDQGDGIPKGNLLKIFDPYFSTKQTGSQKGLGLGLTTTRSIINRHEGYIIAKSYEGIGATFKIFLPAFQNKIIDVESARAEKPTGSTLRTGKILLMDDEEMIRTIAEHMLKSLGYHAVLSMDGGEAIELYQHAMNSGEPFDAVILDLTVRDGMGGKDAVKKILSMHPHARVIVSSGYSNDHVMTDFGSHGFSGVLAKPYTIKDMKEVLKKLIS